jgi:putative FmdB family regulatory protein
MPVYDYIASDVAHSCLYCEKGFETTQRLSEPRLTVCPRCGNPITKCIVAPAIGRSKTKLDDRAKNAGFTKLKKLGTGEYEKMY